METEWSGPIAHVGILTELSRVLAGIEASGNVRITADETGIDVDLQDKTISVVSTDLSNLKNVAKGQRPLKMLKELSCALHDARFVVVLSDGDSNIVKLGTGANPGKIPKAMGFDHLEILDMGKCLKMIGRTTFL